MFVFEPRPAPPTHNPRSRNWGGPRENSGRRPGPSEATRARFVDICDTIRSIRGRIDFDAAAEVFEGLTPSELVRLNVWFLAGRGRYYEAGLLAARLAPYHHTRRPTVSVVHRIDGPASVQGAAGAPDIPIPLPETPPPRDPPLRPIPPHALSERLNDTPSVNRLDTEGDIVELTPGAIALLAPHLNGEVRDPNRPWAHWTDHEVMKGFLKLRARRRAAGDVWTPAPHDRHVVDPDGRAPGPSGDDTLEPPDFADPHPPATPPASRLAPPDRMTATPLSLIRNFSIIAHIDHGKSTLADRLIQSCGGLTAREMTEQVLDNMELEKERGITIKAQTVRLAYTANDGQTYQLNLMDTPGHVDFAYEVSRSLAACEGSLLVVDASQGVEAQTLANVYQAIDANHEIVPVLNKIDLPAAEPERVRTQIEDVIGIPADDAVEISAKTGLNIEGVLEALVTRLPAPTGDADAPLKALLVDSWYDQYLGVVILVRIKDGRIRRDQRIRMMSSGAAHVVGETGMFSPRMVPVDELGPGEMGYITASIKTVADCNVGDTITDDRKPAAAALPGFKPSIPVVWCGLFPVDADDFERLRESLGKLRLNDASFHFEAETSAALGFGFRCGFLGLLHLEIIQERLSREFDLDLIATAPSVVYELTRTNGTSEKLHNPADMPDGSVIERIDEPWIRATILVPDEYLGSILTLCADRRGRQSDLTYVGNRAMAVYRLPLNEVVFDFYDRLKSVSRGYASFDYAMDGYEEGDLVRISILVNQEPVDALSFIAHRSQAEARGRAICAKLKDLIPRQLFKIAVQAAIGSRVIARETIGALSKDVTAKCYGGDISRKRKLLEKQKEGKKRMRQFGKVEIPQTAFLAALKMDA